MKLIILIAIIAAATAVKFDSSRCAHGPEYWCQHRNTAEQCGAVQYCQDNVWPKLSLTNDVCTDCKNFLGDIQKLLQNTTVQNMIVNDIKMLCADLGPYADECNSLVDQYGSIVLSLLASELDPATVCGAVGICSSKQFGDKYFKSGSDICTDCEAFLGDLQGLLKNATVQKEIENLIESACQQLGFSASDCSLVVAVAPEVFDFLASELDPKTVCTAVQFCKSSLLSRFNSVQFKAGDQCADCKAFLGDLDAMLQNKTIQNEIVQDLLAVCNYAGSYKEECKLAIQSFLPGVLTQLAGYLDPTTACPAIGFCPSNVQKEELKTNELIAVNSDVCTDCKNFFGDVKTVLMNATNQAIIVKALKTVCADLGQYADVCNTYVDQYGQIVISFLASSMDAGTICNDIDFCTSAGGLLKLKLTGDMCADCEAFFGDVQTLLQNSTVQTMLMNELKSICSLFGAEADECRSDIDSYGPMVFALLAGEIDPKAICTTIQFCKGTLMNTINLHASGSADMCSTCKSVAGEIDAYLNNPTIQKSLVAVLDMLCTSAGSFALECKMMVNTFAPKIFVELATLLEPDTFCSAFGFCSSQKKMVNMLTLTLASPVHSNLDAKPKVIPAMEMSHSKQKVGGDVSCEVCQLVIQQIDNLLTENSTEAEIVAAVDKVCSLLPSTFKTECDALVTEYGSVLIQLLVQKLDPSKICQELGLCSSVEVELTSSAECVLCEFVMEELDSMISDNSTEQEIINALEKVCSYLPTTIQADCTEFVDEYTPEILNLLATLSPDEICTELGLCSAKVKTEIKESAECVLCEFAMKELESLLSENSTEQEILQALEKVCSLLPTTLQDDCNNMIKTYGPEIFELLKTMSPDAICTAIELCASSEPAKVSASGGCVICEFVMKALDGYLSENATREEIVKGLDKVCSLLPSTITADCTVFVNKYADTIIELLVMEMDPVNVCRAIKLCTDSVIQILKVSSENTCDLCKMIVMYGDEYLVKNSTVQEVKKVLNSVCHVLGEYQTQCQSLVEQYGDVIPKLLAQLLNPTKVCEELKLCTSSKKLLGENECTHGPSYWCASMENAQRCNAVVHCKNHVWN